MGSADRGDVITLLDVAERAGVSKATASKALSDRYGVSAATKDRVLQAAAELNFIPNLLARGLGGGRTQTVGMITADLDGRFAPQIMAGVEDALGADRSSVIMCNSRGRPELELHHLRDLVRRSVDGLIVVGDRPEPRSPVGMEAPVPVIYAFAASTGAGDTSVICDNVEAGRLAARHLVERGKRKVVYVGGPARDLAARERATGVEAGLADSGLELAAPVLYGDWLEQWGWDAASQVCDRGVEFDAIIGGDDQIARGVLDHLHSRNFVVPAGAAVIGFDNWPVVSQHSRHPFSTIDMNLGEVGRVAAQALLSAGGVLPGIHRVTGRVVARGTT